MTYTIIKWRDAVHTATHMTMAERMCLLRMQTYADAKTGRCIPGNKRIAREIGSSVTVCKRAWAKAIECGLMTREKRSKSGRMTTSETYLTLPTEQQSRAQERTGGRSSSGPGGGSSSGPPVISQSLISQFNKGEPSQSPSSAIEARSIPQTHPNDGGANHEEFEMTDDDRRPSDTEDTIDYLANEPSGNSGQLRDTDHPRGPNPVPYTPEEVQTAKAKWDAGAEVRHTVTGGRHRFIEDVTSLKTFTATAVGVHHMPNAGNMVAASDKMRAELARPVPQFKGCIPTNQTIAMTGWDVLNEVDILKHRAAWNASQGRHWPQKWDAWAHQFLACMTAEQHHEWLSAVLGEANVPNLQWQTTCVIRIMKGEKRQQRGKGGYGGDR